MSKQILLFSKTKLNPKEILNSGGRVIIEGNKIHAYSDIFPYVSYLRGKITFRKISLDIFQ